MCNAIGPNQYPEKLVPATIQRILNNEPIIVYDKGEQVREWIYTDDIVSAAMTVFEKGVPGEAYNIGSGHEVTNIYLVKNIIDWVSLRTTNTTEERNNKFNDIVKNIKYVENARPGHDFRYSINNSKIKNELGWEPKVSMIEAVTKTVDWYLANQDWVENLNRRKNKQ
jgi:dTDP-glucose 4,6-dehydratase